VPRGWNGTCVGRPQLAHTASKSCLGARETGASERGDDALSVRLFARQLRQRFGSR
jgi:hypothetical protein